MSLTITLDPCSEIVTGPAYRPDTAPFPEADWTLPPAPAALPEPRTKVIRTSTARRPIARRTSAVRSFVNWLTRGRGGRPVLLEV